VSEIDRYDMIASNAGNYMEIRSDGDWVEIDEYERLTAINAELLAAWIKWNDVKEPGWYWWSSEPGDLPVPVSVLHSPTSDTYFASQGQLGWTRSQELSDMMGWWMKLNEPKTPTNPPQEETK